MESMLIMQNANKTKSGEEGRVEGLAAAGNAAGGVVENKCGSGKWDHDVYDTEKELIDIVMAYKTNEAKIAALTEMRSRHRKDAVISAILTPMGAALTSGLIAEARTWGAAAILAIPMIICTGAFTGAFLGDVFKFARLARLDTEAIKKVKGSSYGSSNPYFCYDKPDTDDPGPKRTNDKFTVGLPTVFVWDSSGSMGSG